jgi:hypothetical protein
MSDVEKQPPGWYPHPTDPHLRMWWTGQAWGPTIDVNDIPPPIAPTSTPAQQTTVVMPQTNGLVEGTKTGIGCCGGMVLAFFGLIVIFALLGK